MRCPRGHEMIEALGIPVLDSLSDNSKGAGWWYCLECGSTRFWHYAPDSWIAGGGYDPRDGTHWHMDVPYKVDYDVYVCKGCGHSNFKERSEFEVKSDNDG